MNDPQCASKSILSICDHGAAELLLAKYNTIKIGRYISDVHHQIYIKNILCHIVYSLYSE